MKHHQTAMNREACEAQAWDLLKEKRFELEVLVTAAVMGLGRICNRFKMESTNDGFTIVLNPDNPVDTISSSGRTAYDALSALNYKRDSITETPAENLAFLITEIASGTDATKALNAVLSRVTTPLVAPHVARKALENLHKAKEAK